MEALRSENLSKEFGGVEAVRSLSFSVASGEHLAIIGPNGAGKSTLINLLSGEISPTAGRVYYFGKEITGMSTYDHAHLGISRSFQTTTLFLGLSVIKNISLALHGTRSSRFQMFRSPNSYESLMIKAKELLKPMELWEKRDALVRTISYGERRKLEIALSLAAEPKLLLLDEPSTGLTSSESSYITKRIRKMGKNISVILVAHDMDLVFGVAQRIIVLHHGQIITQGKPEEIQANSMVKDIYMGKEKKRL